MRSARRALIYREHTNRRCIGDRIDKQFSLSREFYQRDGPTRIVRIE